MRKYKSNKEQMQHIESITKMVDIDPTMLIIVLNFNGVPTPIKKEYQNGFKS